MRTLRYIHWSFAPAGRFTRSADFLTAADAPDRRDKPEPRR
jgi:hypothetical protein